MNVSGYAAAPDFPLPQFDDPGVQGFQSARSWVTSSTGVVSAPAGDALCPTAAVLRIQSGKRLIQRDGLCVCQQCAGQRQPALHAAGPIPAPACPPHRKAPIPPAAAGRPPRPSRFPAQSGGFPCVQPVQQAILLKNGAPADAASQQLPLSGRSSPSRIRSSVVLPAPEGAHRASPPVLW